MKIQKLGFPWHAADPFLFAVHHVDRYPAGNDDLGPAASLDGRDIGQDFAGKDGWRMYHGELVPGFPAHPHRGFETVTIVTQGLVDHADSLGAACRYGEGDVQWLTAGRGIQHSEMFPLRDRGGPNTLQLFQLWLNLPRESKMAEPHFSMMWSREIPRVEDGGTTITVIAGALGQAKPKAPPPASWASRPDADVAIWLVRMKPGARWTLPPKKAGVNRTIYFYGGDSLGVGGERVKAGHAIALDDGDVALENGEAPAELLLLQGKPIGEPIAAHGPFVMNEPSEVMEAFADYRKTRFGGWPWPSEAPVHPREQERFARHPDGRVETS
jgi:redox-sensitive bicupin YhaK (pirin superfamily)